MSSDKADEIASDLNKVDWTNQESLLKFQYKLVDVYGFSKEEAEGFTQSMIEANDATSNLTTTVDTFGDLYIATERLNKAL